MFMKTTRVFRPFARGFMILFLGLFSCQDEERVDQQDSEIFPVEVDSGANPVQDPAHPTQEVPVPMKNQGQVENHHDVIDRLSEIKTEFLEDLAAVSTSEEAEAFVAGLDQRKEPLRALLKRAGELPPVDAEVRSHYQKEQDELVEESEALRAKFSQRMERLPDAGQLREILRAISLDEEAEALNREFGNLYRESTEE